MLHQSIILAIISVLFISCTNENKNVPSKVLKIGLASPVGSFDPIHVTDDPSSQVVNLFYQPLLKISQEGHQWPKTEANILKELPAISADGKEIRLELKAGIQFHESSTLNMKAREANAKDLAATILRNADRSLNPAYPELADNIEGLKEWWKGKKDLSELPTGLKIVNDATLVVRLTNPAPNWWYNLSLANFSLVPAESFGKQLTLPAGSGNYILTENSEVHLVLQKKGGSGPEQIEYKIYGNRADEANDLFKKGELDLLPISPEQATTWLQGSSLKKEFQDQKKKSFFGPSSQYVALIFNPDLKWETKKDLHSRMNQHLDRAYAALNLGPLLQPCISIYRCDLSKPESKKYDGKVILKATLLLGKAHGDAATRSALTKIFENAGIAITFVDGTISTGNKWTGDLALIDLNMATYDPSDLLTLGNASEAVKAKMTSLKDPKPTAAALENLSVWSSDESDLITLARRRSAVIANPNVSAVSFNIHGWLDPRENEASQKGTLH